MAVQIKEPFAEDGSEKLAAAVTTRAVFLAPFAWHWGARLSRHASSGGGLLADERQIVGSENARIRARIFRLAPTMFRIDVERLVDAIDAFGQERGEFWSVISGLTSFVDSEERALQLANENMRCATSDSP
jgi:hypothetical protein